MQSKTPDHPSGRNDKPSVPTGNQARVAATKSRIFEAVIRCLDEVGYSEASINRVQTTAGVSRGALTYHFPSKEAMIVETLERLLDPVQGVAPDPKSDGHHVDGLLKNTNQGDGLEGDLTRFWSRVVNTPQGRALVEILVAARTDSDLRDRISPTLQSYHAEVGRNVLNLYKSINNDAEDVTVLWSICRVFLRGLHTQAPYETDPDAIQGLVRRFAQIMAPHMTAQPNKQDDAK